LHEQVLDLGQKRLTEVGDGIMVGMQSTGDEAQRDTFVRALFQLARTEHARRIAVKQQTQQNFRCDGFPALAGVPRVQLAHIQLSNHIHYEPGQVVRRQRFTKLVSGLKGFS
jgi:hypothetical protein